tara:strand:- start:1269 stop:1904 length:636 start_codon:yes stop_codon:yes gene_type:complete
MSGLFITFEGIEGCGKTTQIKRLANRLDSLNHNITLTREPGGTDIGEAIREIVKHPPEGATISAHTELLLMNASRTQLIQQIILPALKKGNTVLCDRFYDSTLAYQGYGRQLDLNKVHKAIELAIENTKPNLTLLLDIPLEVSTKRVNERQLKTNETNDQFDRSGELFFKRVLDGFKTLAKAEPERFQVINANQHPDDVSNEIWQAVKEKI